MIEMDPILPINHVLYFGRGFQPGNAEIHVLVVARRRKFLSLKGLQIDTFRRTMFPQPEVDTLRKDCIQFAKWRVGIVHNIPSIWEFMKEICRCTSFGKILWRLEEKHVLSIILKDWRKASSKKGPLVDMELRSIVIGSPGIGKSTLLVLHSNCLLYLGYENGRAVHYELTVCSFKRGIKILEVLIHSHGALNLRLFLNGFVYEDVPDGLRGYTLLGTSQQMNIKSQDRITTKRFLLPCWSKKDLFSSGANIYDFKPEQMEKRDTISGGSVRGFMWETLKEIARQKHGALHAAQNARKEHSNRQSLSIRYEQFDRLCHTYVKHVKDRSQFTDPDFWVGVIDSEFVIKKLSTILRSNALLRIYKWAKGAGDLLLAGIAFKIYIHRLVCEYMLSLFISD
uniref:Crinkler (CRN) family protein putative n=1 Tax=Albugo laibachii Nc14 TaxID=890382 RepID=F0WW22_9STRA|nr:Crinkler (CRN) family protein putative [Albugo laibachii Nc14]|eukprot:CCA25625.1 Crinkler (CRN) family protein putative [Albugo laibachii Nc14]